ncbi:Carbon catabolite repressor [Operophtera brumata]|uniref:Carbon catabolite repressor n=1 Tax=Operophtera brumata TaxID=104452 RepID=A0A0L7K201_OPEBR|nr:Carbon catabolite repressor [Operophtera brumata]
MPLEGTGKCTFGKRMDIDIHMLNEIITREVNHFRNYKIYRPNFGSVPVTAKFYAAHDQFKSGSQEEMKKIDDYHHNVSQSRVNGPHSKYPSSATENMV